MDSENSTGSGNKPPWARFVLSPSRRIVEPVAFCVSDATAAGRHRWTSLALFALVHAPATPLGEGVDR